MMKHCKYFAAVVAVLAIASCNKENVPDELEITSSEIASIPASGGTTSITLTANNPVKLSLDASWLESDAASWTPGKTKRGVKPSKTFVLTASGANASVDERTAKVTFEAGSLTKTIEVTQLGKTTISASETEYSIVGEGGELAVVLRTNVECTMESKSAWVSLDATKTKAVADHTYIVVVEPNTNSKERSTKLVFKGPDDVSETVSLTQSAASLLESSDNDLSLAAESSDPIEFLIRTNTGAKVRSCPEWMSYEWTEQAECEEGLVVLTKPVYAKLVVTPQINLRHEERVGELVLEGIARPSLTETITFTQEASPYCVYYTFSGNYPKLPFLYGGSGNLGATVSWGDGSTSLYNTDDTHTFSTRGDHTICVKISEGTADKVRFESLSGISKIDLRVF